MCIAMVSSAAMGAAVLCWLSSWNNAVALTTGNFPESRTVPLSSSPPSISIRPQLSPSEAQFGCTTRSSRFSPTRRHKSSLGDKLHLRPWTALPATKQLDGVPINGESDTDDTESSPWLTDPILQDAKLVSGTDETTALEPKERPEHPSAPPMTYKKYVTMNSKRVPVQIRYTANSGLRPYFLTVAKRLKEMYPDVLVERIVTPRPVGVGSGGGSSGGGGGGNSDSEASFEVVVDGRAVVRLISERRRGGGDGGTTIHVSMHEVEQAIARARRRRRPSTVYGEEEGTNVRLELLKNKATEIQNSKRLEQN